MYGFFVCVCVPWDACRPLFSGRRHAAVTKHFIARLCVAWPRCTSCYPSFCCKEMVRRILPQLARGNRVFLLREDDTSKWWWAGDDCNRVDGVDIVSAASKSAPGSVPARAATRPGIGSTGENSVGRDTLRRSSSFVCRANKLGGGGKSQLITRVRIDVCMCLSSVWYGRMDG
jgi:hypothetical protein